MNGPIRLSELSVNCLARVAKIHAGDRPPVSGTIRLSARCPCRGGRGIGRRTGRAELPAYTTRSTSTHPALSRLLLAVWLVCVVTHIVVAGGDDDAVADDAVHDGGRGLVATQPLAPIFEGIHLTAFGASWSFNDVVVTVIVIADAHVFSLGDRQDRSMALFEVTVIYVCVQRPIIWI